MRFSTLWAPTLKEDPKDAEIDSHKLMLRSGMIRKIASGIYALLPLGLKSHQKVALLGQNYHHYASHFPKLSLNL